MSNSLADYRKCVIKQFRRGNLSIDCRLGIWANVSGKCHTSVERKAFAKFKLAMLAGAYDLLIKGEIV